MTQYLKIQRVEYAFIIEQGKNVILSSELLQSRGVIPSDWQLSSLSSPVNGVTQIIYNNGVQVLSRDSLVSFLKNVSGNHLDDLAIPDLAYDFLHEFSELSFQGLGLNIEGYLAFRSPQEACNYLIDLVTSAERSTQVGKSILQALTSFTFQVEHGLFTLTARNGVLRHPGGNSLAVIGLFGNYFWKPEDPLNGEQTAIFPRLLRDFSKHLYLYHEVVNSKFIASRVEQPV